MPYITNGLIPDASKKDEEKNENKTDEQNDTQNTNTQN